ncbi:MAG: alpha/beta hydrolase [Ardenticatenaceae bacterium]|nr:alpha/beta hydrolase [Ardenticatenaceae bacterium]MCB9443197.1 alpha/beta hydrolase [Ardenticatenaceae bacterium]
MFAKIITIPPLLLLLLLWLIAAVPLIFSWRLWRRVPAAVESQSRINRIKRQMQGNFWSLLVGAAGGLAVLLVFILTVASYRLSLDMTRPYSYEVDLPDTTTLSIEEISIASSDDVMLAGWFVPPQNGAVVILLHGFGGSRGEMIWHAEKLVEAGFGVLLYDERATAESTGDYRSFGWQDTADVTAALDYLNQRSDVNQDKIGMAGCSAGGQIALRSAAQTPEIAAVWAEGASIVRAADYGSENYWLIDIFMLVTHISDGMTARRLGITAPPPLSEIIGNIAPRPIMLLAGAENGLEVERINRYASLAGSDAAVWQVPGGYHCDGFEVQPDEYAARMVDFFTTALDVTDGR